MKRTKSFHTLPAAVVLLALAAVPAVAQFPTTPNDDSTFSIGKAIIWVEPVFASFVSSTPGWNDPLPGHWSSPFMFDNNTVIGHSAVHTDSGFPDIAGTNVGLAGTTVKDSDFALGPHVNEGPPGTREVHTEVYRLNLEEPLACGMGFSIIAGTGMGVSPPSIGEVEALGPGSDFPAESFFHVYVEINAPFGVLFNQVPLVIHHPSILKLPPDVVYIHGLTSAVDVFFKNGPYAGQRFGVLRLAGHQVVPPPAGGGGGQEEVCPDPCGYCPAKEELENTLLESPMMECENPDDCYEYHLDPDTTEPKPVNN